MFLQGTRCVSCGSTNLTESTHSEKVICETCRTEYDVFNGVPCLASYQASDVAHLVSGFSQVRKGTPDEGENKAWLHYLINYHNAEDKELYLSQHSDVIRRNIPLRHKKMEQVLTLLDGLRLNDMNVLHIGAGDGLYTSYLKTRNARSITALEFNPMAAQRSAAAVPDVNWFSASERALPFIDEYFDLVFCEAGAAMNGNFHQGFQEMLRVLKSDGVLISQGHNFLTNRRNEADELARLNADYVYLSGKDKALPRFSELFDEIDAPEFLKVEVLSSELRNFPDTEEKRRIELFEPRWWPEDEVFKVADSDGSVSFRVTKKMSLPITPRIEKAGIASPVQLLKTATGERELLSQMAKLIPADAIDSAFPGDVSNARQHMALGWRLPDDGEGRVGFNKASWFLNRNLDENKLHVTVSGVPGGQQNLILVIDGAECGTVPLSPNAKTYSIDMSKAPAGETFVIEFVGDTPSQDINQGLFRINGLSLQTG